MKENLKLKLKMNLKNKNANECKYFNIKKIIYLQNIL